MNIKTIIIDDEPHCADRLKRLLLQNEVVSLVAMASTVEEGVEVVNRLRPDLIFLDVQLGDRTGFDLLQSVSFRDFEIIFTTAYENYALRAIKSSAIDYLLKPIDEDDLAPALQKIQEQFSRKMTAAKLDTLLHNISQKQGIHKKMIIPTINGFELLNIAEIIRCESNVNYTTLFLKDKRKLVVAKSLKEFEVLLGDFHFFRVHNSHLINLEYIQKYQKGNGGTVILNDGSEIAVSTRRKEDFLRRLFEC